MTTYIIDSVNGDDANDGITAPWKTLAKHNASTFSAGDVIELVGNFTEILDVPSSGASGNPIIYRTKSGEAPAVIDGEATRTQCIDTNQDYVTFENIVCRDATSHCFYTHYGNEYVICRDMVYENSGNVGALIRTNNFSSFNCVSRNNTKHGMVASNFDSMLFDGDVCHDNGQNGFTVNNCSNVLYLNCKSNNNGTDDQQGNGWGVSVPTSTNIRLLNCESHHNMGNGIGTFDSDGVVIEWSSFHHNVMGTGVTGKASGIRCDTNTANSVITGNIIYSNESGGVALESAANGCLLKENIIHDNARGVTHTNGSGAGHVLVDNTIRNNLDEGVTGDIVINSTNPLIVNGLSIAAINLDILVLPNV